MLRKTLFLLYDESYMNGAEATQEQLRYDMNFYKDRWKSVEKDGEKEGKAEKAKYISGSKWKFRQL